MVWHASAPAIVMLINLEERDQQGERKCSCYWPTEEPLQFENGAFTVSSVLTEANALVVKRTFLLERNGAQKTIVQYHVNHWPDQQVIDKKDLAALVLEVDRIRTPSSPILAHCSAGLGRTGTFLAALEAFDRLKRRTASPTLVFDIVAAMRRDRHYMVQTPQQYVLIHDTLELLRQELARLEQEDRAQTRAR